MWSSVLRHLSTDTLWGAVPLSTSPTLWSTAVGSKFLSTHLTVINMKLVFSSTEQKEQVSNLSVVHRHRRHVVVVIIVVNFSHFCLLLQNHRANFNQTWHNVSLGKWDSSLFKGRASSFPKGS